MSNFTLNQDISYSIDIITEIEDLIKENKKDLKKNEEALLKVSKVLDEDIHHFRDFLKMSKTVEYAEYYDE